MTDSIDPLTVGHAARRIAEAFPHLHQHDRQLTTADYLRLAQIALAGDDAE